MTQGNKHNLFLNSRDIVQNATFSIGKMPAVKQNKLLAERVFQLVQKLGKNEFQLVILGQFKRGKTTLINALLGNNVLPTAIIPLTSIVTIIKYSNTQKATVLFTDGRNREISFDIIGQYVTEVKNPGNIKGVDRVIIEYPSSFLKNGIQIIDTPGVGSVYKHNTDVAYEFVPQADAGIFVFTADPPISESELQFLKSVKDYLGKIIFVQNKIDRISETDRQESLEFTKKVINGAVSTSDLLFFQLSAKDGLEGKLTNNNEKLIQSRLADFEGKLLGFLMEHKGQILLISVATKLLSIIEEVKFSLQIEKQAVSMPVSSLKEKISLFNKELETIKQEKEDNDYILQGQTEKLVNQTLLEDIESLKERQLPKILNEYDLFYKSHRDQSGKELFLFLDRFLEESIKKIFTGWRKEEENKLQKSLESLLNRFSSQTNEFIKRAMELTASLFNIKVREIKQDKRLAEQYEFKFSFDEYQVDIDFYTPVVSGLPKFLSHRLLYKSMRDKVIQVFDQHCGRSRYDFHQRVLESINNYRDSLDEVLDETVNGIKIALEKGLSQQQKNIKKEKDVTGALNQEELTLLETESKIKEITKSLG